MARNDRNDGTSYPKDVFDNPPAGPVGVHRGNMSVAARVIPFVVVVVVAALLGMLAWGLFSGEAGKIRFPWQASGSSSQAASRSTSTKSDKSAGAKKTASSSASSSSATASASTDGSSSASATQTAQSVNKSSAVRVINATGITGYAAQKAKILTGDGYTNVSADNPTGQVPTTSVVWYQNETDKATAQDVASTLGISQVEQVGNIASPVVVVLLQ